MMKVLIPVFLVGCASVAVALHASDTWFEEDAGAEAAESRLSPGFRPEAPGPRAVSLKMEDDGHFWADTLIEGARVRMMVDTGSTTIALTTRDAERIGYDPGDLAYDVEVRTAGGIIYAAPLLLKQVRLGGITVKDVRALVLQDSLEYSLLGQSFINELSSHETRKTTMIMRQ
ncbi:MAG: TIGR02281 family clan AA aspartic protease [Ponticaulis sp.]|nr:TIGR02281 family clan AA aspartic protease [Ponticaulis sp.]|tara:strand:- start:1862 stop:2380 length:519 start_codon:yes stop_codon:yes gene_type:complete